MKQVKLAIVASILFLFSFNSVAASFFECSIERKTTEQQQAHIDSGRATDVDLDIFKEQNTYLKKNIAADSPESAKVDYLNTLEVTEHMIAIPGTFSGGLAPVYENGTGATHIATREIESINCISVELGLSELLQ